MATIRQKQHPEKRKNWRIKREYGITLDEYRVMMDNQGGVCKVCGKQPIGGRWPGVLSIDHDHQTGEIRGLLCPLCNTILGSAKDDPNILEHAADYIEKHRNL